MNPQGMAEPRLEETEEEDDEESVLLGAVDVPGQT